MSCNESIFVSNWLFVLPQWKHLCPWHCAPLCHGEQRQAAKLVAIPTSCVDCVEPLPAVKGGSQSSPGTYYGLGIASLLCKMEHGIYRRIRMYCTSVMDPRKYRNCKERLACITASKGLVKQWQHSALQRHCAFAMLKPLCTSQVSFQQYHWASLHVYTTCLETYQLLLASLANPAQFHSCRGNLAVMFNRREERIQATFSTVMQHFCPNIHRLYYVQMAPGTAKKLVHE